MGAGTQPLPWIHVKDLAGLVRHSIEEESMEGVYNAVAPQVSRCCVEDNLRTLKYNIIQLFQGYILCKTLWPGGGDGAGEKNEK